MNRHLLIVAAITWVILGLFLMTRGIDLLLLVPDFDTILEPYRVNTNLNTNLSPFFIWLSQQLDNTLEAGLFYVVIALALGTIKAKTIFRKIVSRNVARITKMQTKKLLPIYAFSMKDYIVMSAMMLLGIICRALDVWVDIRGCIILAVGAALLQGSIYYFQARRQIMID